MVTGQQQLPRQTVSPGRQREGLGPPRRDVPALPQLPPAFTPQLTKKGAEGERPAGSCVRPPPRLIPSPNWGLSVAVRPAPRRSLCSRTSPRPQPERQDLAARRAEPPSSRSRLTSVFAWCGAVVPSAGAVHLEKGRQTRGNSYEPSSPSL